MLSKLGNQQNGQAARAACKQGAGSNRVLAELEQKLKKFVTPAVTIFGIRMNQMGT